MSEAILGQESLTIPVPHGEDRFSDEIISEIHCKLEQPLPEWTKNYSSLVVHIDISTGRVVTLTTSKGTPDGS
jgi:hypothetical protein